MSYRGKVWCIALAFIAAFWGSAAWLVFFAV